MTWPFKVPDNKVEDPQVGDGKDGKPPEKTPAELIAESLGPLLNPLKEQLEAQARRFDAIEERMKPKESPPKEEGAPVSVLDDENVAFAQRLTPLMARQLELEARVVKSDIKNEYIAAGLGETWRQFEKDINQIVDNTALVTADGKPYRGDPQYIRNVVDMIFGRAARTAGMRFDGKNKNFFLESAGGSSENNGGAPPADGMTDNQRKVISRMGIPLDKAKETLKKLQFVS